MKSNALPPGASSQPTTQHGPSDHGAHLQRIAPRFIRFSVVRDRTALSRSTIWRLERRGAFPKHRRISLNAVGWLEAEVDEWMLTRDSAG